MAPSTSQIGTWLRAERSKRTDYSIEDVAQRVDVTERAVRKWEKGVNPPPADKFLQLVELYGSDIRDLVSAQLRRVAEPEPPGYSQPLPRRAASGKQGGRKRRAG